jgi:hypothetical protein
LNGDVIGQCAAAPRWKRPVDAPEGLVRVLEVIGKTLASILLLEGLGLDEDSGLKHGEAETRRLEI